MTDWSPGWPPPWPGPYSSARSPGGRSPPSWPEQARFALPPMLRGRKGPRPAGDPDRGHRRLGRDAAGHPVGRGRSGAGHRGHGRRRTARHPPRGHSSVGPLGPAAPRSCPAELRGGTGRPDRRSGGGRPGARRRPRGPPTGRPAGLPRRGRSGPGGHAAPDRGGPSPDPDLDPGGDRLDAVFRRRSDPAQPLVPLSFRHADSASASWR